MVRGTRRLNKLEGIPQRIIDKVDKERKAEKILYIKLIVIPFIIILGLVWLITSDFILLSIIMIVSVFIIPAVFSFVRGIN